MRLNNETGGDSSQLILGPDGSKTALWTYWGSAGEGSLLSFLLQVQTGSESPKFVPPQ